MENEISQPIMQAPITTRKGINWWMLGFFIELLLISYLVFIWINWQNYALTLKQSLDKPLTSTPSAQITVEQAKVQEPRLAIPEYPFSSVSGPKTIGGYRISIGSSSSGYGEFFSPMAQSDEITLYMDKSGLQFASQYVLIENVSNQKLVLDTSSFGLQAGDKKGERVTFGPEPIIPASTTLYPGQYVRGWVTFMVDREQHDFILIFSPSTQPGAPKIKLAVPSLPIAG